MKSLNGSVTTAGGNGQAYAFGPFRLDPSKRRLWKNDQAVSLTPKALDTLVVLVERGGRAVQKEDLLKLVWPGTFVTEESLTQAISTIRKALGDTADSPLYIATLPRRGYQFIHPVERVSESQGHEPIRGFTKTDIASADAVRTSFGRRRIAGLAVAAVATIVAATAWRAWLEHPGSPKAAVGNTWQMNPPTGTVLVSGGELSPDGRIVAFIAADEQGTSSLWVQPVGSLEPRKYEGTNDARDPFWSPDGAWIGFYVGTRLKRIGMRTGTPETLAETEQFVHRGASWGASGVILYCAEAYGPLYRLNVDGSRGPVTRLQAGERLHAWPYFLPDGRRFVYRAVAYDPALSGTYLGSLDSHERIRLLDGSGSAAVYADGHLLFVRDSTLFSQPVDENRGSMRGTPSVVASDVAPSNDLFGRSFSAANGVLTYISGRFHRQLAWIDRDGRQLSPIEGAYDLSSPSLSSDDKFVLAGRPREGTGNHLWVTSTVEGSPSLLDTGSLLQSGLAAWSHDNRQVVFTSAGSIYRMPVDGTRPELVLKSSSPNELFRVQDWSTDDQYVIYYTSSPKTGPDVWAYSLADRQSRALVQTPADEAQAQLSPDRRWLAYTSDESGQFEVYVQSFPEGGSKRKISMRGGGEPQWRPDGLELFYFALDHVLMTVEVTPGGRFGTPRPLFRLPLYQSLNIARNHYAVGQGGRRFLVSVPLSPQPPITVQLHAPGSPF